MHQEPVESPEVTAIRLHTDDLLRRENVVGCGVGARTVADRPTDEPAIVVFVTRKLPPDQVDPRDLVPRTLPGENGPVATDVVEAGHIRLLQDTTVYDPLRPGGQIQGPAGWGTLGAICYDASDLTLVMLTNSHVLTAPNARDNRWIGTAVRQPFGGGVVGSVKRVIPWTMPPLGFGGAWQALVDAGIASVNADVGVRFDHLNMSRHRWEALPASRGDLVIKRGAASRLTQGTVETTHTSFVVSNPGEPRVLIGRSGLSPTFSVRSAAGQMFAVPGDSGAMVMSRDLHDHRFNPTSAPDGMRSAFGLVFSGNAQPGGLTFVCDVATSLAQLGVSAPFGDGVLAAVIRRASIRRSISVGRRRPFPPAIVATGESITEERRPWPHLDGDGAGGDASAGARDIAATFTRFRARHLRGDDGGFGTLLDRTLGVLAVELANAYEADDDFAGLLDRALGDWLVQPTVYDMLEYRLPENFAEQLIQVIERFPGDGQRDLVQRLRPMLANASGERVRDVLSDAASTPAATDAAAL